MVRFAALDKLNKFLNLRNLMNLLEKNTHFIRPRYFLAGHTTNFFSGFVLRKTLAFEEIVPTPIS